MAFRQALRLLYERAKERGDVRNQDDFAKRHGFERPTMNQMMTGNYIPPAKTMWEIIEREGYNLADCVDLPEVLAQRDSQLASVETLLKQGNGTGTLVREFIEFLEWKAATEEQRKPHEGRPPPQLKKRRSVS